SINYEKEGEETEKIVKEEAGVEVEEASGRIEIEVGEEAGMEVGKEAGGGIETEVEEEADVKVDG
ncbi:13457_t:CDS:1, partial [Entrophospora sp. SA101]